MSPKMSWSCSLKSVTTVLPEYLSNYCNCLVVYPKNLTLYSKSKLVTLIVMITAVQQWVNDDKSTKIIHKSCRRWRPHNLSMATSRVGFSGGPSGHSRRGCGRQTCQMCIAGAKWLPVILIMAIVSWSYYAYIVHLCVFTVLNEAGTIEAIILATIYHLFLVPFIASYWKTVWTHPGKVNVTFRIAIMIIIHFFSGATKLCFNYLWSRYHWICLWTPKSFRKSSRQQGFGSVDAFHARRNPLLFWVLTYQTWPMSSLLHVQWMCSQNGSPLPLGQQLCGIL